ncbi:hypothetical protein [Paracoccus mutanolyticus]|uniref:hypothetical protein n=1 Tax=Paracoccus mutanolyticus TaxID=1499308 RepID=UPI0037C6E339
MRKFEDRHRVAVWQKEGRGLRLTQAGRYLLALAPAARHASSTSWPGASPGNLVGDGAPLEPRFMFWPTMARFRLPGRSKNPFTRSCLRPRPLSNFELDVAVMRLVHRVDDHQPVGAVIAQEHLDAGRAQQGAGGHALRPGEPRLSWAIPSPNPLPPRLR